MWQEHRAVLWFGLGSVTLYRANLLTVLWREWRENAEHDRFGGVSNFSRFSRLAGGEAFQLWGEPLLVLTAALLLRTFFGEHALPAWLLLAAVCPWGKEALNRWLRLRQRKRRQDMLADAEEAFEEPTIGIREAALQARPAVRKDKTRRPRSKQSNDATNY